MKLFVLIGLLVSSVSFAHSCPDFSGKYAWTSDDGEIAMELNIAQSKCDSLELISDLDFIASEHHVLDGKKHVIYGYPEFKVVEVATIDEKGVHIFEEHWIDSEAGPEQHFFVDTVILKPSPDQVVVKSEQISDDGTRSATKKFTFTRKNF